MSAMDDLVTWYRAQLDGDERVARQMVAEPTSSGFYLEAETDATNIMTVAAHVYRWSPARVLAEVAAKRRIVELAELAQGAAAVSTPLLKGREQGYRQALTEAVRELAQPYAERPGWREEWRA